MILIYLIYIYSHDSFFGEIICHVWIIDIKRDFIYVLHSKQGPLSLSVLLSSARWKAWWSWKRSTTAESPGQRCQVFFFRVFFWIWGSNSGGSTSEDVVLRYWKIYWNLKKLVGAFPGWRSNASGGSNRIVWSKTKRWCQNHGWEVLKSARYCTVWRPTFLWSGRTFLVLLSQLRTLENLETFFSIIILFPGMDSFWKLNRFCPPLHLQFASTEVS